MPTPAEQALTALRLLLRSTHLAGPDDLPALVQAAGSALGATTSTLYLADYDQLLLVPVRPAVPAPGASVVDAVAIDTTLAGRCYTDVAQHTSSASAGPTLWTPVLDGTERLGVLQMEFPTDTDLDDDLRATCLDVAALVAELVMTRSLYGDAVERTRRRTNLTVPAEIQWGLLPPLTFVSPRAAVAGVVAPTTDVAGDSFDYALNGDTLHVAIIDAMGHGMEAALLSSVAIGSLRNSRRAGAGIGQTVRAMDAAIAAQFGPDKFVTGVVGQLDVSTGWWRWTSCGHPAALLVRGARVVKSLDQVVGPPMGIGLLREHPVIAEERLEPGDRLVHYTDGVVEARNSAGEFFGTDRLIQFVTREEAAARPAAETLRRLSQAILTHQEGELQDDATTVLVEWLSAQPDASTP